MFGISKDFTFAAAHHLPQLPDNHKCRRVHGHNYTVRIEATKASLDDDDFVFDYACFDPFAGYLKAILDHRDLNEVIPFMPTAERLAHHLWRAALSHVPELAECSRVRVGVSETPSTWAWYSPDE